MQSSEAFLINTLMTSAPMQGERSADERQADEERQRDSATKPGGFQNDPDDPTNPNEVRENHLKQVKKITDS